jgi:hypothetical protein
MNTPSRRAVARWKRQSTSCPSLRSLERSLKLRFVDAPEVRYARSGEVSIEYGWLMEGPAEWRLYAVANA